MNIAPKETFSPDAAGRDALLTAKTRNDEPVPYGAFECWLSCGDQFFAWLIRSWAGLSLMSYHNGGYHSGCCFVFGAAAHTLWQIQRRMKMKKAATDYTDFTDDSIPEKQQSVKSVESVAFLK